MPIDKHSPFEMRIRINNVRDGKPSPDFYHVSGFGEVEIVPVSTPIEAKTDEGQEPDEQGLKSIGIDCTY